MRDAEEVVPLESSYQNHGMAMRVFAGGGGGAFHRCGGGRGRRGSRDSLGLGKIEHP